MKVKTKDFQLLKGEHEFEFPVGITILQGESATGKSSLIYAIQNCLTNPSGVDYCINHDAKCTEVTIENNDNSVTWIKTHSSSEYRNNKTGESFVKASKLDSRDIADLGFYFDPKGNVINIHDEWSVLFPFALNNVEMFKLFEDIFNISCASKIIDDIKKDEQDIKSQINTCHNTIDTYKKKKEVIKNILCEVNEQTLQKHIQQLTELQQSTQTIQQDYDTMCKYIPICDILVPPEFNVDNLIESHNKYINIINDLNVYINNVDVQTFIIPDEYIMKDINVDILNDYNSYQQNITQITQLEKDLQDLLQTEQQIEYDISQIKVCPTCGREL